MDEIRQQVLTEFKQVYKLHPADYTENCTNVVMSIISTEFRKAVMEDIIGADLDDQDDKLRDEQGNISGVATALVNGHNSEKAQARQRANKFFGRDK